MTDHPPIETLLRLVDGRLPPAEETATSSHLDGCPECQAALDAYLPFAADQPVAPVPPVEFPTAAADRFAVVRPLSDRGGMGELLVALDTHFGREVAYKRVAVRLADSAAWLARFKREAVLTGRLEHPGIPPVYAVGVDSSGRPFYAMRLVDGPTLLAEIRRAHAGGLRPDDRAELLARFVSVCNTVAYAHRRGYVHRDLKPENVLAGQLGETVVLDWGLAKRTGEAADPLPPSTGADADVTGAGSRFGTRGYMSPEQAAGDWPRVGPASDVFSLGATLFHLLAGVPPDAPAATDWAKLPRPLAAVCRKAMHHDPAGRYPTAEELAGEVGRWLRGERVLADIEPWRERAGRWAKRNRPLVAAAVAAVAIAAAAVPVVVYQAGRAAVAEAERGKQEVEAKAAEERRRQAAEQADALQDVAGRNTAAFVSATEALRNNRTLNVAAAVQMYDAARSAADRLIERTGRRPEVLADKARLLAEFSDLFATDAGQTARGERMADEAVALIEEALAVDAARPEWLAVRAQSLSARASARALSGNTDGATRDRREALDTATRLTDARPDDPRGRAELARAVEGTGRDRLDAGDAVAAEAWFRRALDGWRELERSTGDDPEALRRVAGGERWLAQCLSQIGDAAEADALVGAADGRMTRLQAMGVPSRRFEQTRLAVLFAQIDRNLERLPSDKTVRDPSLALIGMAERLTDDLLTADLTNAEWRLAKARCRFLHALFSAAPTPDAKLALLATFRELVPVAEAAAVADPTNLARQLDVLDARYFWARCWLATLNPTSDLAAVGDETTALANAGDALLDRFPSHFRLVKAVAGYHRLAAQVEDARGRADAAAAHSRAADTIPTWIARRLARDPGDPAALHRRAEADKREGLRVVLSDPRTAAEHYRRAAASWAAVVAAHPESSTCAVAHLVCHRDLVRAAYLSIGPGAERYAEYVDSLRNYDRLVGAAEKAFPRTPEVWRERRWVQTELADAIRLEPGRHSDAVRKTCPDAETVFAVGMDAGEKEFLLLPPEVAGRSPFTAGGRWWWDLSQDQNAVTPAKLREVIAGCLEWHRGNPLPSRDQMLFLGVMLLVPKLTDTDPEAVTVLADALAVMDDLRRLKKLYPFQERLAGHFLAELGRRCESGRAVGGPAVVPTHLEAATRRLKAGPK